MLSESDEPRERRKPLGLRAEGDDELPGLKLPEEVDNETHSMSVKTYCKFELLEKCMGKVSWFCSLDRLMFSIFFCWIQDCQQAALAKRTSENACQIVSRDSSGV